VDGVGYRVEEPEPGVLATTFIGSVTVADRLKALDAIEEAARLNTPRSFLIDFSRASITAYGATDALMLTQRIARERRPFGRVAYVLRADQADMVAGVLTSLHGRTFFRRFEDAAAALAWLRDISPVADSSEPDASSAD
jgi:hypothetical protein